jgi:RNA polymerase sigma-70 factor (ECF subfamily)
MAVMDLPLTEDAVGAAEPPRDEVADRWVAEDPSALDLAVAAWGGAIQAYCSRRLPPSEVADATQEVFVSAWRARHQFDPARGSLSQWLFGIARNTCVAFYRKAGRTPEPTEDVPRGLDGAVPAGDEVAERLVLAGALAQLPERQRRVVVASFVDGWTNQEVAERLELPLGTVKSDIRRGLRALRVLLEGSR